ncbi:MAG: 50S ribosomal protein L25 [Elusimicrobiota bacterium]|jgi:large subunit ribosomal protein L25
MAEIELKVQLRSDKGSKKALTDLRKNSLIPGIVYGGKGGNTQVVVGEKELLTALKKGGKNVLLRLKHDKGEDTVIVKELQRHVVTSRPIHADFQRVSLTEKIDVKIRIVTVGEAPGVKLQGGIQEQVLRELKVRCFPNAIPEQVQVDVSKLNINETLYVSDLQIPEGVEVVEDPKHIVVHIVIPAAEEEKPAEDAVPGAAEPEVIAKGKKDEDEEGAAPAKDAKGAPAGKADAKPAGKAEAGKKDDKK